MDTEASYASFGHHCVCPIWPADTGRPGVACRGCTDISDILDSPLAEFPHRGRLVPRVYHDTFNTGRSRRGRASRGSAAYRTSAVLSRVEGVLYRTQAVTYCCLFFFCRFLFLAGPLTLRPTNSLPTLYTPTPI